MVSDTHFQIGMGYRNHPLCSVFSNSVPLNSNFHYFLGGMELVRMGTEDDPNNPSQYENRGLKPSRNLECLVHFEHPMITNGAKDFYLF